MAQESDEEKIENVFALDKLPKSYDKTIESHGYQAYFNPQLKNFVCFKKKDIDDNKVSKGHKFHISIDDPENDKTHNFEKAWPIIIKTLTELDIADFKVVHGDGRYQPQMQGKQITIYAFKEPDRKAVPDNDDMLSSWQEVFQKLSEELTKADIRPGILASTENINDKEIKGSNYISYRSDSYNKDMKDPFESIQVNCKNQLAREEKRVNKASLSNDSVMDNKEISLKEKMSIIDESIMNPKTVKQGTADYMNLYRDCLRDNKVEDAKTVREKIGRLKDHLTKGKDKLYKKEDAESCINHINNKLKELDKTYNNDENKNNIFSKLFASK